MPNIGIARLRTEHTKAGSIVREQFSKAPLQIHRPLYLTASAPPVVFIKTPSSGLLDGDEHLIELDIGEDSAIEVRTQACTLAYPGRSSQTLLIRIAKGGQLKFHPHLLILGCGAELKQRTSIFLQDDETLDYQEEWCAGRIAMKERWMFKSFDYQIEISRREELVFRERWCLTPAEQQLTDPGIAGDFTHFRTRYLFGKRLEDCEQIGQSPTTARPGLCANQPERSCVRFIRPDRMPR